MEKTRKRRELDRLTPTLLPDLWEKPTKVTHTVKGTERGAEEAGRLLKKTPALTISRPIW